MFFYRHHYLLRLYVTLSISATSYLVFTCNATNVHQRSNSLTKTHPAWMLSKPISSDYYVGIGRSLKGQGINHFNQAKKSALEDLASSIQINISSVSFLNQIDENNTFREQYKQAIKTTVSDKIEGYEQVDDWEDEKSYWVYYQLSKRHYNERKTAQRKTATTQALDFYKKAKQYEHQKLSITSAISFYIKAFNALSNYLNESIQVTYEGKDITLITEIHDALQHLFNEINLEAKPSSIEISRRISSTSPPISIYAKNFKTHHPIRGLALRASFEKGGGQIFPTYETDEKGHVDIFIDKISTPDVRQSIRVKIDIATFYIDTLSFIKNIMSQLWIIPSVGIDIKVSQPTIYLKFQERVPDNLDTNDKLITSIKKCLKNTGFELVNDKAKAKMVFHIDVSLKKGLVSGGIHTTLIEGFAHVLDRQSLSLLYETTLGATNMKGYHLDYQRSVYDAYEKVSSDIKNRVCPQMAKEVFH